jgi:hypothetical protein
MGGIGFVQHHLPCARRRPDYQSGKAVIADQNIRARAEDTQVQRVLLRKGESRLKIRVALRLAEKTRRAAGAKPSVRAQSNLFIKVHEPL